MSAQRLRVAVVGAGGWGEQHARIFARRPDTELVAIVGRTPERAEARAAAYGTTAYTDLEEMLTQARPDLVTTCLPNEEHFAPTLELIRHNVPLLVEKPFVFSVAEADQLLAEAEERGLFFAINFNHRYAEAVQRAHAAIAAGELGDIVHVTWRFGGEANPGHSPHRNLIETQCHGFDMLEHLAGPISSVMAQMTNKTDETVYNTMAIAVVVRQPRRRQSGGELRLLLCLSRHPVHRGQRHARAGADPRHGPGADPLHGRRRDAAGVAAGLFQR